jgi:glycosyltransferase involved in cell wall biosynthesis
MFGWEFPPFKTGGLGTACAGLTKGLARNGAEVTFVMPVAPEGAEAENVKIIGADRFAKKIRLINVPSALSPYGTAEQYEQHVPQNTKGIYGRNIYAEAKRFARVAREIARAEGHNVIHVHDWMTYEAGIEARKVSKKPLVAHIHATEYDRTGGKPNAAIARIERAGLRAADIVIANSEFTKKNVLKHYNVSKRKIRVVHWGIDDDIADYHLQYRSPLNEAHKTVLFLGRVTRQKGPSYFVEVARKVLQFVPNALFVIAGDGDQLPSVIHRAHELGIGEKVIFTGFLKGADVHRAFQMADVYVMPSVSEPFGLVALESLKNNTPVIVSRQSGVSEVLKHCLVTDYWDVRHMANLIVNVLRYPELREELRDNGRADAGRFNLDVPAQNVLRIYDEVMPASGRQATKRRSLEVRA